MKRPVVMILGGFLLGLLIVALFSVSFVRSTYQRILVTPVAVTPDPEASPTPTPDPNAPFTVLLLGYGGGNHAGAYLTDSMIAARVDPIRKLVTLISIPRDLWIDIPVSRDQTESFKINHAYMIGIEDTKYPEKPAEFTGEAGGGMLAKYAVSQALGIPVDYFVSLNFRGFVKAIDTLGGVDVMVPVSFSDPYYPITGMEDDTCGMNEDDINAMTATMSAELLEKSFLCRYEELVFTRGVSRMDGDTALKYVRSRHSPTYGNDFSRSERQRSLLIAVRDRIMSMGAITKIPSFISVLAGDLKTDITTDTLTFRSQTLRGIQDYEVSSLALNTDNVLMESRSADGQYILIPQGGAGQWTAVQAYIADPASATASAVSR